MSYVILFDTSRSNVSESKEHFMIHACCIAEDTAAWLGRELTDRGLQAGAHQDGKMGLVSARGNGRTSHSVATCGNAASKKMGGIERHDRRCGTGYLMKTDE